MRYVYLFGLMLIIGFSCGDKPTVKTAVISENSVDLTITHSAGDRWGDHNYLPLPFNVGSAGNHTMIVVSDRIENGKSVSAEPIGAIKVEDGDSLKTYVIALPLQSQWRTVAAEDIDEFATIYSSAKWIIEQYLVNRKGTNLVKLKSWESKRSAINYLLKDTK